MYIDIKTRASGAPAGGDEESGGNAASGRERLAAAFHISYRQYLDAAGALLGEPPAFARDRESMVALYRIMVLTRAFDTKAIALQRTGRLGTYPSCAGQEAVGAGYAGAMSERDVMFIACREQAAQISRGVTLKELLQFWGGDERGCDYAGPREDFPPAVPIATHIPHAVGAATAFKLRGEPRVAMCALGDGATSKGEFYESLNLAGVWQLPIVFVVVNNHWAISLPREKQTACETLAQKAIAGDVPAVQIDGNDVIAMRHVAEEAVARARKGGGPTLIEAITYRLGGHTTADDASRYRREEVVSAAWKLDPLARLRIDLTNRLGWTKADEELLIHQCREEVEAAVAEYLAIPPPKPETMFDHLFETLPSALWAQRAQVEGRRHD